MTLSSIQQSFASRSFDVESISLWLAGITGICAVIIALWIVRSLSTRHKRYSPHGKITDADTIRNILRAAFDQRRPFEIQVQTGNNERRPTLRCAAEYLGATSFSIEINGIQSLSPQWIGKPLTVFFRINVDGEFVYYTFHSSIQDILTPRPGTCHITLPLPIEMENRQKRAFLRMAPPPEFLLGAAIWQGQAMPLPEAYNDLARWPRPHLLYLPDRMEHFRILDLSAGGCRISIPSQVSREFHLEFAFTEQIVIMLDLFDPEQNKRLRFWLQCRVQSIWLEHASRDMHIGLQFLSWARPSEALYEGAHTSGIEWLRLSAAREVEMIGNWIMRRHLEVFRDVSVG